MQKIIFICALCGFVASSYCAIGSYDELVSATIQACNDPSRFLSPTYTNDLIAYRNGCTGACARCTADLSLAICLMYRMDNDENCVGSNSCYEWHQSLVTNILEATDIDTDSWIKHAAAVEFMYGLNYDSRFAESFVFSTNMLAQIDKHPSNMGKSNFWDGIVRMQNCRGMTPKMAFQVNAAIHLAEQKRHSEMGVYTNSLPAALCEQILDFLK